ncbi:MAG: 3-hydroxyacyl-CoA dehydrogenase family protein [Bacteroidota bacterium]
MNYLDKLENVTVLGAAGKMGSGILLVTAMEMLRQKLKPENRNRSFVLYAMDVSQTALEGLMRYIKDQALKTAEKNIVSLRRAYAHRKDLVDNEQIIREYVLDLLSLIRPGTRIEPSFDSRIVFEAVSERPDLKVDLLLTINRNSRLQPWFFTNTSSIPIAWLDERAGLEGRVMGVHFYNPPAVQKLVEVIKTGTTNPELSYFVSEFIKNTGKIAVPSYDVAGFIGNGYFMRDILYAEKVLSQLQGQFTFPEAVYMLNKISQDYLIRPMGIFQLCDYVGLDVVDFIMSVMDSYIQKETIQSPLVVKMLTAEARGGQNPDGTQKDGFFSYSKGKITGVFDLGKKRYVGIEEPSQVVNEHLGPMPVSWMPWKQIIRHPHKGSLLGVYFDELKTKSTPGALLAQDYLKRFREIGMNLVKDKIAFKYDDVNAVLVYGFHHAYGPVTDYF